MMRWGGNRRATPRVIQAIPLDSVREASNRASCLPSLIVAALFVGIAFLEGAVPAAVAVLR